MPPKKTAGRGKVPASDIAEGAPPKKATKGKAAAVAATSAPSDKARPVDREVPNAGNYKVVADWAVKLNQTNVGANNNKFYIIQVLVDKNDHHYCWTRWGRVGEPGQNKLDPCGTLPAACAAFQKKFKDKTLNAWGNLDKFQKKDGKYGLVETAEEDGNEDGGDAAAPMGKLSRTQIEKAQKVLAEIEEVLESKASASAKSSQLEKLSSQFFTLIPTDFGRRKPVPITTLDQVNEKDATLKFLMRMGFEEVETKADDGRTPLAGIDKVALANTLAEAMIGSGCGASPITSSVKKGDTLAKKKAGKPQRTMTKEEYGSILLYTSNAIYQELNRVLREEDRKGISKYMKYIKLLLHAASGLPSKPATLWRGLGVDLSKQYKTGQTITWWGVSSCTTDKDVATGFANGCSGESTLVTLETKTACDISAISFYSNEKESLLMPGTHLLVKKVEKKGKVAHILLEETGRAA